MLPVDLVFRRRLPAKAKIDYKLSTLCHSFFSDSSPACVSGLLAVCTASRQLRSSADTRILHIPRVKKPKPLANALPLAVLQSSGIFSLPASVTFSPPMPSELR